MAIIETESNFKPMAIRYEENWKYLYMGEIHAKMNGISYSTEKTLQKFSWGLMQVMGTVLRELGFSGSFLEMVDPALSIEYGCRKLKELLDKHATRDDAIAAYNAGSAKRVGGVYVNQSYVDKVNKNFKKWSEEWK